MVDRALDFQLLALRDCKGVELLHLTRLKPLRANFSNVPRDHVVVFPKLSALTEVSIRGWNGRIWTSVRSLVVLERLQLYFGKKADAVPNLQNLKSLRSVDLIDYRVKNLSGLRNSTFLTL